MVERLQGLLLVAVGAGAAALACAAGSSQPTSAPPSAGAARSADPATDIPATPKIPVTDTYHGIRVVDPYRWLEDSADPKVHDWSEAQNRRTRRYLDGLPQRAAIYQQLFAQISATSSSYHGLQAVKGQFFAFFNQPPKQQPMIALLGNEADPAHARILVDPNTLNPKGTTAIDWFVPSPDAKLLAVSMSENGSEAEYLIKERYTDRAHLAIMGASNGGLLIGAVLTQRPELARAVVSLVGIYDLLRVERDPNGLFNTTEFGSVQDPEQFKALYAYSPFHHVKDATGYPAIFMATGETDGRVNPAHSRKMIARLQAASNSARPIDLSINSHAGHGIGSALSIRVNQEADYYAFLFDQLGISLPRR